MLRLILVCVLSAVFISLGLYRRTREIDEFGNPCVRYLGPRFSIPLIGLCALIVGIIELTDPVNYRYSGNLLLLAYIPIAISVGIFAASVYYWSYRITLEPNEIKCRVWSFQATRYLLADLVSLHEKKIKNKMSNVVLQFSGGRQLNINGLLSGQSYFVERVKALTNHPGGPAQKSAPTK